MGFSSEDKRSEEEERNAARESMERLRQQMGRG